MRFTANLINYAGNVLNWWRFNIRATAPHLDLENHPVAKRIVCMAAMLEPHTHKHTQTHTLTHIYKHTHTHASYFESVDWCQARWKIMELHYHHVHNTPPPSLTHTDEMEGGTEITPVKVKEVGQRKGFDDWWLALWLHLFICDHLAPDVHTAASYW